jgi:putative lipoprotein
MEELHMRTAYSVTGIALVAILLAGCGKGGSLGTGTVTGTVTYLQGIVLPPDAELYVVLQDISLQDAPARTLAATSLPVGGQRPPFSFSIDYDRSKVDEQRTYSVHAEIRTDGQPRFVSTQSYPVITRDAGSSATIVVMALEKERPQDSPLEGTYWRLIECDGKAAVGGGTRREPHLTLLAEGGRVAATGGCNQMTGGYKASGNALSFTQLASTRMNCPDIMNQEDAFARALGATARFTIRGRTLAIMDSSGRVLAQFAAAEPEE